MRVRTGELAMQRNELMAQVIVEVPKEWQTDDVPEDVDWKNPNHLIDYILDSKNLDLVRSVVDARIADAGNSLRA